MAGDKVLQEVASLLSASVRKGDCLGQSYTLSAGVAQLASGESLDELIQRADEALYAAKTAGCDRAFTAEQATTSVSNMA